MSVPLLLAIVMGASLLGAALAVPIRPGVLRIVERLVCPRGNRMQIHTSKLSYHRPGERGLVVMCEGTGGAGKVVTGRAFVCLWLVFFLVGLPFGLLIWSFVV